MAERTGVVARTRLTPTGGNIPQKLVHQTALRILSGDIDVVAVVGSEAMHAASLARKSGQRPQWTMQGDEVPRPELVEEDRIPFTTEEYTNGLTQPVDVYPLFENARRARLGWSLDEQRRRLGSLWHQFARVAEQNPYAWMTSAPSAETIAVPSSSNRMVAYPYTKLLVANLPVDMGAAYIMASYGTAVALGVPRDHMVFPQMGADATDHWFVSQRPQFDASPAMSAIWAQLRDFGARTDELHHIDLYSCFPTVVQTACDVLGIDAWSTTRPPTLTGGLTFGGGPGNNYVTHSIAAMVDRLRSHPGETGLVTGLGWFSTKHAWGTYSTEPAPSDFQHASVQDRVDALEQVVVRQDDGPVTVETYTVVHDRSGEPIRLVVAGRHDDGTRVWAKSEDVATMMTAELTEIIGLTAHVRHGVLHL
jgi:acetyl-CoA C-acetyltransferase